MLPAVALLVGLGVAIAAAFYVFGSMMARHGVANVYERRPGCVSCGRRTDRPVLLWRCNCGEQATGPAVADDIRDARFFEGSP